MSVLAYFSKRQPTHTDKHYAHADEYDPVLRAHLHLKPPEPETVCTCSGRVQVNEKWMTKEEYQSRYLDFSTMA